MLQIVVIASDFIDSLNYYWSALQSMSVLLENVYSIRDTQELAISFSYSDHAVLINAFR